MWEPEPSPGHAQLLQQGGCIGSTLHVSCRHSGGAGPPCLTSTGKGQSAEGRVCCGRGEVGV